MATPSADLLLQTKIRQPRLKPQLVERAHLLHRLEEGLVRRVTLLSAPAGYGKTSLLTQWVAAPHPGQPVFFSWLSLDPADNSLERFLRYLIAALQKNLPEVGAAALAMLAAPLPPDPNTLLATLINDLEACAGSRLVLVLDDFHVITGRDIFDLLDQLIEHQPDCLHLVLAGRSDPPLGLAGLRAAGDLTELRAADLRFSTAEAAAFLENMLGISLQPAQVAALEQRTEGWIAGLQLAALSMRDRADVDQFIQVFTGSHRFILDYLADEVLRQQPEAVQDFLLRTSILDRFTADLCKALLKDEGQAQEKAHAPGLSPPARVSARGASQILSALERANLFLIPLDDTRTWYRYHTLFADLLRFRLTQTSPDAVPGLHSRAAAWFQNAGLLPEAVQHAAAAGDTSLAGRLVEEVGESALNLGQVNRFLGWLDTLPTDIFSANPRLHMLYVFGLFSRSQFALIEPRLSEVERAVAALPEPVRAAAPEHWRITLLEVTACRAILSSMADNLERTIQLSNAALEGLPNDFSMRASVLLGLGVAYRLTGKIPQAADALHAAAQNALECSQAAVAAVSLCNLGDLQLEMGFPDSALENYNAALRVAEQFFGSVFPVNSLAYTGLADVAYLRADLPGAAQWVDQALRMDELWGNVEIHGINLARRLRIELASGESAAAQRTLAELQASSSGQTGRTPHIIVATISAEIFGLEQLGLLDEPAAAAYIRQMEAIPARSEYLRAIYALLQSHAWRALARLTGQPADAQRGLALAEPLPALFHASGLLMREIEARVLVAALLARTGQTALARSELLEALNLAAPIGLVQVFPSQGEELRRLLASLLPDLPATHPARALAERALAAFPAPGKPAAPSHPPAPSGEDALSAREVEVLRLAELGLSNAEIAARLTLAPGTVKRHMHNIFEKLDAASRPEAIHKARAAGLLA